MRKYVVTGEVAVITSTELDVLYKMYKIIAENNSIFLRFSPEERDTIIGLFHRDDVMLTCRMVSSAWSVETESEAQNACAKAMAHERVKDTMTEVIFERVTITEGYED